MQEGESPEAARQAALRQFGNVELVAEVTRSKWGFTWLEQALNDVRYAARGFVRTPLFSAIVIVTLALGIEVPRRSSVCSTASYCTLCHFRSRTDS